MIPSLLVIIFFLAALWLVERRMWQKRMARLTELYHATVAEVQAEAASDVANAKRREEEVIANAESESITRLKKYIEALESYIERVHALKEHLVPRKAGSYLDTSYLEGEVDDVRVAEMIAGLQRERQLLEIERNTTRRMEIEW